MKLFAISVLFLLPCFVWAQLFPEITDFHGNITKVTERRYGKELNPTKRDSGAFKPGKYSGWRYAYLFDENLKLAKRTNSFKEKIQTEYNYLRSRVGDRIIVRETIGRYNIGKAEECREYENFTDSDGRISKVNFWLVDQKKNTRDLFQVEMNAEYKEGRLRSFTRHNVEGTGRIDSGEKCELFYDSADRLVRIERTDIESNLKTVLYYVYNNSGFLDHYSVDFLVGLPVYRNNPKQEIYYKCDNRGNWVKKYRLSGKKKLVEAKRKISYR